MNFKEWLIKEGGWMKKDELEQLRALRNEIRLLEKDLNKPSKQVVIDKVSGSDSEFPYTQRGFTIQGIGVTQDLGIRKIIRKKIANLIKEVIKMETYLDTVDDSEVRQILRLRYKDGYTLEEIGTKLGYHKTTIQKKIDAFLKDANTK